MKTEFQNVKETWAAMKAEGDKYRPLWLSISKYVGITVDPDYIVSDAKDKAAQRDEFIDDPTAALSVNQAGDYLIGILWGTGDGTVDIVPSRYVLDRVAADEVDPWYSFATSQLLYHTNHSKSGFHTALRKYAPDQIGFGNSGIGSYPNQGFEDGIDDHAIIHREYGIDNTRIREGKNGTPETIGCMHRWELNRIINQFAMKDGELDDQAFAKLPRQIKDAYNQNNMEAKFNIVYMVYPSSDFNPRFKGKRGARYHGVWFMDDSNSTDFFYQEYYAEKPISFARMIVVRNEDYGRASGTLLLSTIRAQNYIVGRTIEILEKMADPSLGAFSNAIFGDSVLDSSAGAMTMFNSALAGVTGNPVFPLYDVGDPSGIIKFLIPYLNEKVVTGFKVDSLLDFSSAKEMTATESLQRYVIRGKSLSGMLQQQKTELLEPTMRRNISILQSLGELGIDPREDSQRAKSLIEDEKGDRVIPEAVLGVIAEGKPWYELKFNNELEKLTRTDKVQNLVQILQSIIAIAQVKPEIIEAVNWHKLLSEINDNLDYNNQIVISELEFKTKIEAALEQQKAAMMLQAGQAGAQIQKDAATANKMNNEAQNAGRTQ